MIFQVAQVLLILVLPYILTKLTYRMGTQNWLSPVVLCYLAGMGICNLTSMPLNNSLLLKISQGTILFAIPLLLYSTDIIGWLKLAKSTILSFFFVIISVIVSAVLTAWFFKENLDNGWMLAGMLTGVYIGGTPNMNAVGIALEASEATFITLNAAEIVCGGLFLIFLTSVAHQFFGLFLRDFEGDRHEGVDEFLPSNGANLKNILIAFALTLALVSASALLTHLVMGNLNKPGFIILAISAFSIGASLSKRVRSLQGSYETGEYLLLMFSIAIGMMADMREIFTSGGILIAFSAIAMLLMIFFHTLLCKIFKIDRDTMIITVTAGIYGPPFIGQVAAVIKNRSLVFSGIATGLVGIAIANFIGVALANILFEWMFK